MDIQVHGSSNQCSLKWNKYQENLLSVFDQLLQQEALVDVTLATEGRSLRCHKVVLSACSSYFKSILSDTDQTQHPIVILRDVTWSELQFIVEYMYKGEINVSQEELPSILKIAESLKLHGLVDFESKGSASGVSIIKRSNTVAGRTQAVNTEAVRQKRKRQLIQSDENSAHSDAESTDLHKSKYMDRNSPHNSSPSPSSISSLIGSKDNSDYSKFEQRDRHSVSQSSTPQPPNLVHKPPPPPTNSPMSNRAESNSTPPKMKEHRIGSFHHSPSIPLPPSLTSPSTSGMTCSPTNNLLPNLSHFQNQHQKLFPSLPSSHTNTSGLMGSSGSKRHNFDDMSDVKPSILEMIQEERRAKMMEATQMTQNWMSHHAKQQNLANPTNSTGSGGSEPNSQLSDIRNNNNNNCKKASSAPPPIPPCTSKTLTSTISTRSRYSKVNSIPQVTPTKKKSSPQPSTNTKTQPTSVQSPFKSKISSPNHTGTKSSKMPSWSQEQLQEAIFSVITQRMRFTQASSRYGIPKGTLYDNILGKSKRMKSLEDVGLTSTQELAVLEYCCEISTMPYNRRTSRSLRSILQFVQKLKAESAPDETFQLSVRKGFKWWWAFCKKYSIISLYFDNSSNNDNAKKFMDEEEFGRDEKFSKREDFVKLKEKLNDRKDLAKPPSCIKEDENCEEIDVEGLDEPSYFSAFGLNPPPRSHSSHSTSSSSTTTNYGSIPSPFASFHSGNMMSSTPPPSNCSTNTPPLLLPPPPLNSTSPMLSSPPPAHSSTAHQHHNQPQLLSHHVQSAAAFMTLFPPFMPMSPLGLFPQNLSIHTNSENSPTSAGNPASSGPLAKSSSLAAN